MNKSYFKTANADEQERFFYAPVPHCSHQINKDRGVEFSKEILPLGR